MTLGHNELRSALADRAQDIIAVVEEQGDFRSYRLAIEWPSLAAALGELLEAADEVVPVAFRRAMAALRSEKPVVGPVIPDGKTYQAIDDGIHTGPVV